jgi:hypothetical protein
LERGSLGFFSPTAARKLAARLVFELAPLLSKDASAGHAASTTGFNNAIDSSEKQEQKQNIICERFATGSHEPR